MKYPKLFITLLLMLFFAGLTANAQKKIITGKITDAKTGSALEGVSVKAKKSGAGTLTKADGSFELSAAPGEQLVISYVGYAEQTVAAVDGTPLTIKLAASTTDLAPVVMVGSRGAGRTKTESPVPVDVIKISDASNTTAKPDLMSQLNMSVPSFNYNKQSGGDGSDAIDFASLRGLGFDQTLVLINGKRQHLSAFVNQVGTRGRGNSGTDLNAIPEAAIDRIEILRDGASAQYGSDAIAGVINIVLRKDVKHLNINIGESGYYDHKYNALNHVDPSQYYTGTQVDGKTFTLGLNYGLPIGKHGGFINVGANFMDQGKTFRAVPDTNIATNPNALPIDIWRRAFGDGSVTSGGGMYNLEIPIAGTKTVFYSFGGANYKHSNVYAWTRSWGNPHRSQPNKFPTDAEGNLIFVPSIMRVYGTSDGTIGPDNVYYNPQEDVYITDESFATGFKGTTANGWDWDVSNHLGYNDFHYWGNKTFNAALPVGQQATKNRFDDGGFNFLQNTTNVDFTKRFETVAKGLNVSFGAELRYERYKLYAGEYDSYGGNAYYVKNGDTTYKATGSEGYPGYQPSDASTVSRTNVGGYVDLALDVTDKWLIDGAARLENYSDFGFVNTYKLATRYKLTDNFNIRGSVSTGFRAPTLQQLNFSNTNTNIIGGNLVYSKQVPNYSEVSRAAGIPKLTQETSVNASLGFTWKPAKNFTVTVDGYVITIKNRVVISGQYQAGDPTLGDALNNLLAAQGIQYAQFFANAVNTTNMGIDIVLDYSKRWAGNQHFKATLAGNFQKVDINKINIPKTFKGSPADSANFFSNREQYFLKASAPKAKFSLNLEYGVGKFTVGTHLTYFGGLKTLGFGETATPSTSPDPYFPYVTLDATGQPVPEIFNFRGKVTTDVYASYNISKVVTWTIGVDNLFNVHPDKSVVPGSVSLETGSSSWGDSESGGPFDAVQMGFNGLRMFTKLGFRF
jgi:iron complex outermembrane receptor protein